MYHLVLIPCTHLCYFLHIFAYVLVVACQQQKGGALPKFGTWDPNDPTAGEAYTVIFQKLSDEKKSGEPMYNSRLSKDSPARNDDRSHQKPIASKKVSMSSLVTCCCVCGEVKMPSPLILKSFTLVMLEFVVLVTRS